MTKIKTITLECLWPDQTDSAYRIRQVTETVEYRPGQILTKAEVSELCDAKTWKVTMVRA